LQASRNKPIYCDWLAITQDQQYNYMSTKNTESESATSDKSAQTAIDAARKSAVIRVADFEVSCYDLKRVMEDNFSLLPNLSKDYGAPIGMSAEGKKISLQKAEDTLEFLSRAIKANPDAESRKRDFGKLQKVKLAVNTMNALVSLGLAK
jgi:hypothetical protein